MNKLRVFNAQHAFDSRRLHQPSPNGRRLSRRSVSGGGRPLREGYGSACQLKLTDRLDCPEPGEGCRAGALAEADTS
jgi:hypothetical protein